jgi:hypothetical protein
MKTKVPFLRPHFVGKRFEGHSIPLELLKDLATLENMIVDVAKWFYRKENPSQKRLPKGFTESFWLQLSAINDGSAVPCIDIALSSDGLFEPEIPPFLLHAKEGIINAIDAAENDGNITQHLPSDLLTHFEILGRNLLDDECIEFNPDNKTNPSRFNKITRRKLIKAISGKKETTEEITVRGSIHEADLSKRTFSIELISEKRKIKGPIDPQHQPTILDALNGFDGGAKVLIKGVGKVKLDNNQLIQIESIDHVYSLDDMDVGARLDEISNLKDGWLNGKGFVPERAKLDWFNGQFDEYYPEEALLPFVYPTAEGNIQLEWTFKHTECSLEVDLSRKTGDWFCIDTNTSKEDSMTFDLSNESGWNSLADKLITYGGDSHE